MPHQSGRSPGASHSLEAATSVAAGGHGGAAADELVSTPWHALSVEEAAARIGASLHGLPAAEAGARLIRYGPNLLPTAKPRSAAMRLLAQFNNVLIHVLTASALLAALLGEFVDAAVILGVVLVNGVVGFVQEGKAESALGAIRAMLTPKASVMREGRRITIDAGELVPGDLVLLEPGDRVPADLRLVRARNLRIEEAALTGESAAVDKAPHEVEPRAALGDRSSVAFSGTLVVTGQGAGLVVATGLDTELGRISRLLGTVEPMTTPLMQQMNRFGRWLTGAILLASALVFAFAVLARAYPVAEAFMAVVGVAVAAIPEGLPAVLTITLAIGVQRMAAQNAIVRRLPAVETLGSVSIICTDKTGTLTRNEMTVRSVVTPVATFEVTGVGYAPHGSFRTATGEIEPAAHPALLSLTRSALLCNDAALRDGAAGAWLVDGDPMEGALISLAIKAGYEPTSTAKQFPRTDEIPFDAEHRFMATAHHDHEKGQAFACVKGAPEQVLAMCSRQEGPAGATALDPLFWQAQIELLAEQGQRVLAVAIKALPAGKRELTFSDVEQGLLMQGLLGLIDPPREEAIAAVRDARRAGIRVKMITGDHALTARAIARQLGLERCDEVATGQDLDGLDERALITVANATDVFARTSPEHKLRLVHALQAERAVVAMTGDGVNDAPALKRADVGIAMGAKGTEAAKEAAEMVLADDNFASIIAAVREGRTVYDNLRKIIAWSLPTNGGEALAIVTAILLGLTLPVTPVQILWINMVTTVALGLTLAFEPTESGAMQRPPRPPGEPLLSGVLVWRVGLVSVLFVLGVFAIFAWSTGRGRSVEEARTAVVNAFVVMEIAYLFSVRYVRSTSLTWQGVLGTPAVLLGVGSITVLQFAFTYLPFMQGLFDTRPLPITDGLVILGAGIVLLLIIEAEKLLLRYLRRPGPAARLDVEAPTA